MDLKEAVCSVWDIHPSSLSKKSKLRRIVEPRHIMVTIETTFFHRKVTDVAIEFGIDHSTVTNCRRKFFELAKFDSRFRDKLQIVSSLIDDEDLRRFINK